MQNYQLGEITTRSALRTKLADHFRRVQTDNPKVIDILLFKGQAEAHELMAHYTQRHHLVRERGAAVSCPATRGVAGVELATAPGDMSEAGRGAHALLSVISFLL